MMPAIMLGQTAMAALRHPLDGTVAEFVWLLPLLPLLGATINGALALWSTESLVRRDRARPLVSIVAVGVLAGAFGLAVAMLLAMRSQSTIELPFVRTYAEWMPVGTLRVAWGAQLDQLSALMVLVVTGVGTLIHVFSIGYMKADLGFARFFAYLNLFVAFMLVLVLGSSYPVLFVGWEGVGLCSYLLIGFWFSDARNAEAGKKAFVVNRVGDFGFLAAMFLIWTRVHTLDFVGAHAALSNMSGTPVLLAIALFLFLGCAGKSAQLPLYVWLPDAMAGPTPVSALIHAATMVTAGVYLVARAAPVFAGAPQASLLVTAVGAITALFAATIALRQWDIKKVLAYSTISQLGYMFMAVGSGAYAVGVFHLVTHAFFKALLFLGAGSVIHALHAAYHRTHREEDAQDLRNMGGLARLMPWTAGAMMLATLAIVGVPPLAGFFSKDAILAAVFLRAQGSPLASSALLGVPGHVVLYAAYGVGLITALLTAVYMMRLMMLSFFGANRSGAAERDALHDAPPVMTAPVVVLGLLTVAGGWLNLPKLLPLGPTALLEHWLEPVTGASSRVLSGAGELSHATESALIAIAVGIGVVGIAIAVALFRRPLADKTHAPPDTGVAALLASGYHVDDAINAIIVRPVQWLAATGLARGFDAAVDRLFSASGTLLGRAAERSGERLQDGDVGKYAWFVAAGALAILAALTLA